MATDLLPILFECRTPDSDDVFFEPASIKATTGSDDMVLIFNDTSVKDGIHGSFTVPSDYVDTASFEVFWATSSTSTADIDLDIDYRAIAVGESVNQAADQETLTVNDLGPGTAWLIQQASMSITDANLAANDVVKFVFSRDGATEAGGGLAAAIQIVGLYLQYDNA